MYNIHFAPITQEERDKYPDYRSFSDARKSARRVAKKLAQTTKTDRARKSSLIKSRRSKSTEVTKWLRELIDPLIYGEKKSTGVRPSITHDKLMKFYNIGWQPPSIPNYRLKDHFEGEETLYFMARADLNESPYILAMLDVDAMKAGGLGSKSGAEEFIEHLKETYWPNLYAELSTGGIGQHGYWLIMRDGYTANEVNKALKRLEKWLRYIARNTAADIEQVEVKGTCPEYTFDEWGKMRSVKSGSLAKLPRDARRFSEWKDTTVLTVADLLSASFDVPEDVEAVKNFEKKSTGSISGKAIDQEALAALPHFKAVWREWYGERRVTDGRAVTDDDGAICMLILRHFYDNPNADGTCPVMRAAALWNAMRDSGEIERGWSPNRWKFMRDLLSARGHINWADHRYERPTVIENGGDGKVINGVACKWAITAHFSDFLSTVLAGSKEVVGRRAREFADGSGENLRPVCGCVQLDWDRIHQGLENLSNYEDFLLAA